VWPTEDAPHNGRGGSFHVDLSAGLVGGAPPPPPPPPPQIVHVGDLDGSRTPFGGTLWIATVTVTAHDAAHVPLSGVTVTGSWAKNSSVTCVTSANGTCSLTRLLSMRQASVTFTVKSLSSSGYTYSATANHDPDGDSTGTAIRVLRP
jgi:hypothetical protein